MKIEHRDRNLKYPSAIRQEKIRIVLDWILEFRFSSIDLLAKRLGSNSVNEHRFFNAITENGMCQLFKNIHTGNTRYLMLTKAGLSHLEILGRDTAKRRTSIINLGKYSHVLHDMAVQYAVLKRLDKFDEVIWDRHIDLPEHQGKPDVLLHSPRGYWVALEYERWRKDSKRIYLKFYNHFQALSNQLYSGVFYLFDNETDLHHYEKLFGDSEWPRYKRDKKEGKIKMLGSVFRPDELTSSRH
jgi:AraC-like DNA-binding protein